MGSDRVLEMFWTIGRYPKEDRHSVRQQELNSTHSICLQGAALQIRRADRRTRLRLRARNRKIFPLETTHLEQRFQEHLSNQTSRGSA